MYAPTFRYASAFDGTYLARVYALLAAGISATALVAWQTCAGEATVHVPVKLGANMVTSDLLVTPAMATVIEHPWMVSISVLLLSVASMVFRFVPGLNAILYGFSTLFTGLLIAPGILLAQARAGLGLTLTANPVRDVTIITVGAFLALSVYALVSGKDFSRLGGFLMLGLWCLLGAGILNIFFGGTAFALAISSVAILVYGGFVLYDTSNLRDTEENPFGHAIQLHLDAVGMFMHLLRIFTFSKD